MNVVVVVVAVVAVLKVEDVAAAPTDTCGS